LIFNMISNKTHSMTGFGIASENFAWGSLIIELRSVNSRFLELHFKMPDQWRGAEPVLRELLQQQLKRGKVECRLSSKDAQDQSDNSLLSPIELQKIAAWQTQVQASFKKAGELSVYQVIQLAKASGSSERFGSGQAQAADAASLGGVLEAERHEDLIKTAQKALTGLIESRQREGAALASTLKLGLTQLRAIVDPLAEQMPTMIAAQQQKLSDRLQVVLSPNESNSGEISHEEVMMRVRQEIGALGLKADIAEELARLNAHIVEFDRSLDAAGPHGKRLDFLVQELNREANTVGSKSISLTSTHASLGLKQVIEQLREQIQNLE
jgi:uncharacterized protein (TIGR00255 family)